MEDPHPFEVVCRQLIAKAEGQPVDEDALQEAATALVAVKLMEAGVDLDALEHQFMKDHVIRIRYHEGDVSIEFDFESLDTTVYEATPLNHAPDDEPDWPDAHTMRF